MSTRAWREANKEHLQEYNRQYRAKHKVRIKRKQKLWITRNYDRYLAQNKRNWERKKTARSGQSPCTYLLNQDDGQDKAIQYRLRNLLNNARQRSHDFTINLDHLIQLWSTQDGRCALTGIKMAIEPDGTKTNVSLDRIDSTQGYTPQNTQLVCWWVNNAKSDRTMAQFISWCKLVVRADQHRTKQLNTNPPHTTEAGHLSPDNKGGGATQDPTNVPSPQYKGGRLRTPGTHQDHPR